MKNILIKKVPDKPGIYLFKKNKQILYVGKATSLRDRIRSYMSKKIFDMRGPLIEKMVEEADTIEWQETDSVLEAIILEANLIKKHQPYYNTKEKDDKSFNYVCITKEKLPKVIIMRGRNLENFIKQNFSSGPRVAKLGSTRPFRKALPDSIFGPYTSGSQLREAMKIIRRIFPFLDEKSKNYMEFYKQINLVPDLNDSKLYLQNIKNIKLFFSGEKKQILRNLKKEMNIYSKIREFEKAGEIKRQIFALQHINDVALIKYPYPTSPYVGGGAKGGGGRIEAYDIAHMGGKNMVGVMTVLEDGEVVKSEYKKFRIRTQVDANDVGALVEVLERRLKHTEWPYPSLIVVDGGIAQINATRAILSRLNVDISLVSVVKDEKHKPKDILGGKEFAEKYKREILLANSEAHRFAIAYHKNMRGRNFLT
jgi:excinuclease UvrABC nuclease subunit